MGVPVKFRHSLDSAHTLVRYKTRLLLEFQIVLYQVLFNMNFSVLVTARSNLSMRETFSCSMIKNLHIN
jgi:hypothetical protein